MRSKQSYLLLFLLALFIRGLAAWPQQQPNYMDATYSYVNALNLVAGRGFVEDFIWNYLGQPGLPPQPSHLYWLPLTSILAWLGLVLGGDSYHAAQIPFIFLSALLAPLTYGITYTLSRQRWLGWLTGLLTIFSGFYFPYWTAIDNFTPFAIAGSLALLATWRGIQEVEKPGGSNLSLTSPSSKEYSRTGGTPPRMKGWTVHKASGMFFSRLPPTVYRLLFSQEVNEQPQLPHFPKWFFVAGLFAGLAHLARADGSLLLLVIVTFYALERKGRPSCPEETYSPKTSHHPLRVALSLSLGYLLIMGPWFIRNWQVAGTPLPAAGSQTIWLITARDLFNSYAGLFSYNRELSAQTFLAQGIGPILQGRWWALTNNLLRVLAELGMIFLAPLALIGAWQLRHHILIQLVELYALFLFIFMTFIFAFPGAMGGLFHSGAALLPFIYATAGVGLDYAIDWVSIRRRHWNARLAKLVFGVGLILMAMVLSGFIYYNRVLKNDAWNKADALYPTIAAWVKQQTPTATVMIGNPPAYRYHGGGLSVVIPNENIETTLLAARRYHVDYLILDCNRPEPLSQVYSRTLKYPALSLIQTFTDDSGRPIYIFKLDNSVK